MRPGREASCRDYDVEACLARPAAIIAVSQRSRGSPLAASAGRRRRCVSGKSLSFWRCDAENPTRGAVGGEPQRAVRPVANIANAFAQPLQQALLLAHLVPVDF